MTYQIAKKVIIDEDNESIIITGNSFSTYSLTSSSVTLPRNVTTLNCSSSNYFSASVTGAATWYAYNVPSDCLYILVLELTNGGLGTQTWFNNTKWTMKNPPALSSSGTDILLFFTDDGGSTWYGRVNDTNVFNVFN
jgi:hypothetical protein